MAYKRARPLKRAEAAWGIVGDSERGQERRLAPCAGISITECGEIMELARLGLVPADLMPPKTRRPPAG